MFVALLHKGTKKKVMTLWTGNADTEFIHQVVAAVAAPYAIGTGSVNVAVAKYNALCKKEGIFS